MAEETKLPARAPLRTGASVMAIIPQDIDQVWRMAGMAVMGQMAPKSLVDKKSPEEAQAACAVAIMAGAELGLTPLMALRSYAVVNGRPSLWGDGIKAVVRQSGRCEYIRTGSDATKGWCEAKRSDTSEVKRVEFTIAQAKAARLDQKEGPWKQGYADVMMERRATNRCLNDLFADVLGGLANAEEAIEDGPPIEDRRPARPTMPEIPDAPAAPAITQQTQVPMQTVATKEPEKITEKITAPEIVHEERKADQAPAAEVEEPDPWGDATRTVATVAPNFDAVKEGDTADLVDTSDEGRELATVDGLLATARDLETLDRLWRQSDASVTFADDPDNLSRAAEHYAKHKARIERADLEAAGQGSMFPGDR